MRRTGHRLRAVLSAGRLRPLQAEALDAVARELGGTACQVAPAWLPHRSPGVLLIPGPSSVAHLHGNIAAAAVALSESALCMLDAIGGG
ncbi:aldo/keto reductase [Kitasatospora sp. NPDC101801]|uniref:aldo/keto reductase n=1 Tax=Kitasatospora sp. NPDC101801 TaxID=3364103 RepID=UPI00381D8AE5